MVRISSILMLTGSVLLLLGADTPGLLFAGRIASGIGVGFVMAPGTARIKELSAGEPLGTGARRSTVALTAGFALGPIAAGVLAQAPRPATPHLRHTEVRPAWWTLRRRSSAIPLSANRSINPPSWGQAPSPSKAVHAAY